MIFHNRSIGEWPYYYYAILENGRQVVAILNEWTMGQFDWPNRGE